MTLLNIFHSGGLWIIPFILYLASLWSFYRGYLSSKSNSTTQVDTGTPNAHVEDNTGNVPFTKTPQFKYGVALFVIATIVLIWIALDYQGV